MDIDYKGYLRDCELTVKYPQVFDRFRSRRYYSGVVETMRSQKWGIEFTNILKNDFPDLWKNIQTYISGDKIGGPNLVTYRGVTASPVTLRYVKVLGDLLNCFGSLDGLNVVEIGGGYGGQCKVIQDHCKVKSYTLIDLEAPLRLADRWLSTNLVTNYTLQIPEDLPDIEYDLVISNYAFTEFTGEYQRLYADKVLKKCKRGFIICNFMYGEEKGVPIMNNLLDRKEYKVFPEIPETAYGNFVYTWNDGLDTRK